jgi:hypothetical protein
MTRLPQLKIVVVTIAFVFFLHYFVKHLFNMHTKLKKAPGPFPWPGQKPADAWQISLTSFLQVVKEVWGHHAIEVGIYSHNRCFITRASKTSFQGS